MEVILLENVPKVGQKNDIVEVADGYALNFLIPRSLARIATDAIKVQAEEQKKQEKERREKHAGEMKKVLAALDGKELTITAPANEQGHLFAALHERDIAGAIKKEFDADIDEALIKLDAPIKEAGAKEVTLGEGEHTATVSLIVKGEEK